MIVCVHAEFVDHQPDAISSKQRGYEQNFASGRFFISDETDSKSRLQYRNASEEIETIYLNHTPHTCSVTKGLVYIRIFLECAAAKLTS